MGLDCFFEHPSEKEVSFPADLHLCGGMFSGHGSDGSFRGKVYTEFFSVNLGVSLYSDMTPDEVAEVAEGLARLVKEHPGQAWNTTEGWGASHPDKDYYGVRASEVNDLYRLFQVAASQHCEMVASY